MLSFWEKKSFIHYDYIIIGSGIVGLSTAASIKEKNTNASVLVLEKGILPTGASTKNAGFACFGSLTEILFDLEKTGEKETLQLIDQRFTGLEKLKSRLGDKNIDFQNNGGFELLNQENIDSKNEIDKVNSLIFPLFNTDIFKLQNHRISEFNFNTKNVLGLVENKLEGQIDTGKMMSTLWDYTSSLGVKIITNTECLNISDLGSKVSIETSSITFTSEKAIICTNAFTKKLYPELELNPGRGHVLVTKPIKNLSFKGVFHMDEGYYYFRNFNDRVIFGGGRNLDFETEKTTSFDCNEKIMNSLKNKLSEIILPNQKYEIDYFWTGIMAFGNTKKPIVKKFSDNIAIGVRLNGMGVAIGSQIGEELANIIKN